MKRDIENATSVLEKTAGSTGMMEEDEKAAAELLRNYGDQRESLLKEMVEMLDRSDVSSLRGDWKDRCSRGKDQLLTLDRAVPSIELSGGSLGLTGIGLDGFRRGELDIWNKLAEEEISKAAEAIQLIQVAAAKVVADTEEKIRTIRDDDAVIQEAVRGIFPTTTSALVNTGNTLRQLFMVARKAKNWTGYDGTGPYTDQIAKDFNKYLELARKKSALKQELAKRVIYIKEANDQLGYLAADEVFKDGERAAGSLADGETGNGYDAEDWKEFGKQCKEKLERGRDKAKDQSNKLYSTLFPALSDYLNLSYKSLTDDASQMESWQNEIERLFTDVKAAIAELDKSVAGLFVGPFKDAGVQTVTSATNALGVLYNEYLEVKRAIQDLMDSVKW